MSSNSGEDCGDYEQLRLNNIKEREAMMLEISHLKSAVSSAFRPKKKKPTAKKKEVLPPKKSLRIIKKAKELRDSARKDDNSQREAVKSSQREPVKSCINCRKEFGTLRDLNTHKAVCFLKCKQCRKSMSRPYDLPKHLQSCRQLPARKDLSCELCEVSFLDNAVHYLKHMEGHNEFRFTCYQCKKGFESEQDVIDHKKAVKDPNYKCNDMYKCSECESSRATVSKGLHRIRAHLANSHSVEYIDEILCEHCQEYIDEREFESHEEFCPFKMWKENRIEPSHPSQFL